MKMENEKLYLGMDGKYYQGYELANAYFLTTGDSVWMNEQGNTTKKFDIWVHNLIGFSIKKVVNLKDVSCEEFLVANQKLLAVRAYRDRNNCTLREAKDAIDKIKEGMEISNA